MANNTDQHQQFVPLYNDLALTDVGNTIHPNPNDGQTPSGSGTSTRLVTTDHVQLLQLVNSRLSAFLPASNPPASPISPVLPPRASS